MDMREVWRLRLPTDDGGLLLLRMINGAIPARRDGDCGYVWRSKSGDFGYGRMPAR
jgi:hypothetical protein